MIRPKTSPKAHRTLDELIQDNASVQNDIQKAKETYEAIEKQSARQHKIIAGLAITGFVLMTAGAICCACSK